MDTCKAVGIPMDPGLLLSSEDSPKTEEEANAMAEIPYANAVGSLMYAMVSSRPDLAYSLSILSKFMSKPGMKHWKALLSVLKYVKGSSCLTTSKCCRRSKSNSLDHHVV